MKSIRKIFIMLILLSIYIGTASIVMADNITGTSTATPTTTITQTPTPTQVPTTVATTIGVKKFRVGPTVKIRPVSDEIKKNQDGMIELYMDNPSLNDVTLTVDAHISVPAGLHVSGEGFGQAGAAGTVYGIFEIPPGKARTIYITIKAEKVGEFSTQFSGTYYPGDNKDDYQPISLTHPFKVLEASSNPNEPGGTPTTQKPVEKSPGMTAGITILAIIILAYVLRRT